MAKPVLLKIREFTTDELTEAKLYIETLRPGIWDQLKKIEIESGDFARKEPYDFLFSKLTSWEKYTSHDALFLLTALRQLWAREIKASSEGTK